MAFSATAQTTGSAVPISGPFAWIDRDPFGSECTGTDYGSGVRASQNSSLASRLWRTVPCRPFLRMRPEPCGWEPLIPDFTELFTTEPISFGRAVAFRVTVLGPDLKIGAELCG